MSDLYQSKAMNLLRKLDQKELSRLRDFIRSPYFNKNKKLNKLYHLLFDGITHKKGSLDSAAVLKKVKDIHNERELAKSMNAIQNLAYKFLYLEDGYDAFAEMNGAANTLKRRDLPKHYQFMIKKLEKEIEAKPANHYQYYYQKHLLAESKVQGFKEKGQRLKGNTITPVVDTLNEFYLAKYLFYTCEALSRADIIGHPVEEDKMYELTLHFLDAADTSPDNAFFYIYSRLYRMFRDKDQKKTKQAYNEIKDFLNRDAPLSGTALAGIVSTYLLNYCIKKINEGEENFSSEYLEIIKLKDKMGVMVENGKLSQHRFKNIITTSLKLGETAWTASFIDRYGKLLPGDVADDYINYAWGYVHYSMGEYKKAGACLIKANHVKDVFFGIAIRKLVLKNLCESNSGHLEDEAESMRKFLERNKEVLGEKFEAVHKFVRYFKRFWKRRMDHGNLSKLLGELEEENFIDKDWLKGQIEQAIKKAP